MIFQGQVNKVLKDQIELTLSENPECSTCSVCGGCSDRAHHIITIDTTDDYQIGDKLAIEVSSGYFYRAFFLVFIFPLLVLVTILILGEHFRLSQKINLLFGAIGWIGSYYFAHRYDQKLKNQTLYRIIK